MVRACILDYGAGNVRSVYNLFAAIGADPVVSNSIGDIDAATHLVLPGVGAFAESMRLVRERLPIEALERSVLREGKPFLGICVGMQVLATHGEERGGADGLGWVSGTVRLLSAPEQRLPHIGWNSVHSVRDNPILGAAGAEADVYFVHSFAMEPEDPTCTLATTEYGTSFCSALQKDNIFGVQFHPEKSQVAGRKILERFVSQ